MLYLSEVMESRIYSQVKLPVNRIISLTHFDRKSKLSQVRREHRRLLGDKNALDTEGVLRYSELHILGRGTLEENHRKSVFVYSSAKSEAKEIQMLRIFRTEHHDRISPEGLFGPLRFPLLHRAENFRVSCSDGERRHA